VKREFIEQAAEQASIFLSRYNEFTNAHPRPDHPKDYDTAGSGSKQASALRRTSLDLTRALAAMRNIL
jgi:hypothetical protein